MCIQENGYHCWDPISKQLGISRHACLTSIRSLLAVAAGKKWQLFRMDVKNAFINGDLLKEVYMKPPPSYAHPPNKVCRLCRALYGLKQASRAWFAKFNSIVHCFGFRSSLHDNAFFTNNG